ncbi:isocitrate/isopropylmalate family dehydrogenase, partial [Rhodovulum sulfidophilum]|nr:isocitrate/isopropylmalate family dehydrogenase [Rhodovulum sulfidophilum]
MTRRHAVALIPGDGIGPEVIDASLEVLEKVARLHGFALDMTRFDWSCDRYLATGRMMPEDGIDQLRPHAAILLGAVGWPARVPDAVSLHGLLLPIRKSFDQFANMRPHRLLPGATGPL